MGLDCTAYSRTKLLPVHVKVGTWCEDENHRQAFAYCSFPLSFRGLADADQNFGEFIGGRCYDISQAGRFAFRAGSYRGFGAFRERLARTFLDAHPSAVWNNPGKYADLPFFELINFADNEGCIGPEAALDLYGDFVAHRDAWISECSDDPDDFDRSRYLEWTTACERAADNGFIDFH